MKIGRIFLVCFFLFSLSACDFMVKSSLVEEKPEIFEEKPNFNNNLKKDGPLTEHFLPSLGSPKILVVPIDFNQGNDNEKITNDLSLVFNGTEEETGWESVRSFYEKSSNGKLSLQFDILDWHQPEKSRSYYEQYNSLPYYDGPTYLLFEILKAYDDTIDFSQYDLDEDGSIDAVWLIYDNPIEYNSDSIFWAATYSGFIGKKKFDDKRPYTFAFASSEFMYRSGDVAGELFDENLKLSAHTYIHETGHLLGLDDYYDYDDTVGDTGGVYGADMMDANIGDHSIISKLLLGWVTPRVVYGLGELEVDLTSFSKTGDFILLTNHRLTSIYDEFYLLEFYTNEGLNKRDSPIKGAQGEDAMGIRVYHVNAKKYFNRKGKVDWYPSDIYSSGFLCNNSVTDELFIDMIRADEQINSYYCDETALFTETSNSYSMVIKKYKETKNYNDFFAFTIIEMNKEQAKLQIKM